MDDTTPILPTSSSELYKSIEDYSDIAVYLNDLLDVKSNAQINAETHGDLSELERRVSQLSAVFEVACEDTSAQVERTIEEISRNVPRLTYDLQFMRQSALSLQVAVKTVDEGSKSVNNKDEITKALERLHFLDRVKTNMDASLIVLKEAEAWSSLESEVMGYLREEGHARAAARLSEASQSLMVFQNTSEYDTRKTLLTTLQNQLEASLSSALMTSINKRDIEACKTFFDIFRGIEREAEFRSYWYGSKRKHLVDLWDGASIQEAETETGQKHMETIFRDLATFLSEFNGQLYALIQAERSSFVSIFPNPQTTISEFIVSTFTSLHPTLTERLGSLAATHGNLMLPKLVANFMEIERFAVETEKLMEKVSYANISASEDSSKGQEDTATIQQMSQSRRLSRTSSMRTHRFGTSSTGSVTYNTGRDKIFNMDRVWEDTLFEPFIDYQADYGSLENTYLSERVRIMLISNDQDSRGARTFREQSVDMSSIAEEALQRCMAFTHGYGVLGLIQAINDAFEVFLSTWGERLIPQRLPQNKLTQRDYSRRVENDLSELDYSPQDYEAFQLALHLLEAARGFLERINALEVKIRAYQIQISGAFNMMKNDPFGLYISGTTKGAMTLLQGSTLNSAELHRLLENIDTDTANIPLLSSNPTDSSRKNQLPQSFSLREARTAVANFARRCQKFLQDTILSPLIRYLAPYSSLAVWSLPDKTKQQSVGAGGTSEIYIPSFSLSPNQIIQRVAEGLLNLPRLIEVYADDDALAFSIETLPFIDFITSYIFNPEYDDNSEMLLGPKEDVSVVRRLSSASSLTSTISWNPELVSSAWLTSLSLVLLTHITANILPNIGTLTTTGAAQLLEDLDYLGQIVKTLNVECESFESWKTCLRMDENEVSRKLSNEVNNKDADLDVIKLIARKRGWV